MVLTQGVGNFKKKEFCDWVLKTNISDAWKNILKKIGVCTWIWRNRTKAFNNTTNREKFNSHALTT